MALNTPSNPRIMAPWGFKLTPSKTSHTKTPTKSSRSDADLSLKHVIGTTANTANAIDTQSSTKSLAFTAGAAAVLATYDENLKLHQRFYRARPKAVPLNPTPKVYSPSTPVTASTEFRTRAAGILRDSSVGPASFGSPTADWGDSPGNKTLTAKDRVKAATCVSFSPDGKYLAVGETGYRPRVLIFSTSKESSSDAPLTCLPDHTFGVRSVAFSPNSQYLATLGAANDGFLYVWNINSRNGAATLHSSNKCTTNICRMIWMGSTILTVGTRHVKVWRIDSTASAPTPGKIASNTFSPSTPTSSHKILSGRNCLLGSMMDATFTAVVALPANKAIVCSESGDICLLDDSDGNQQLTKLVNAGIGITAAALDSSGDIVVAGSNGKVLRIDIAGLLASRMDPHAQLSPTDESEEDSAPIVALAPLGKNLVAVDAQRLISILKPPDTDRSETPDICQRMAAHGASVLGVRPCSPDDDFDSSFFTWSADGTILFWDSNGACKHSISVELEQPISSEENLVNELKVVRACRSGKALVTGDKCGVFRIISKKTGKSIFSTRAHSGEVTDIAIHEGEDTVIASSGRDRTVQIFQKNNDTWDLSQTLDEHVGAVTGLLFSTNGAHLISCSSDRTVVVREALKAVKDGRTATAFTIVRTITMKNTPISMTIPSGIDGFLILSTVDRCIHKYNFRTGQLCTTFKASDMEGGEAVVISSLLYIPSPTGQNLIAGVSSTDKSLRLYDDNGTLFGRDWGHTEGVTDLTLLSDSSASNQRFLVTGAADGTVFIWTVDFKASVHRDISQSMDLAGVTPTSGHLLVNKPPLRRVLSQSEMARFRHMPSEEDLTTPTGKPLAKVVKRASRFSLAQTPRLDPTPVTIFEPNGRRRTTARKSPSPPTSPRSSQRTTTHRRPSLDPRTRTKSGALPLSPDPFSLANSTENVCRALRAYRKKLAASTEHLAPEPLRDLERELAVTARAVGEKALKARGHVDEGIMVKLLSQYSERLVEMLDEKFAAAAGALAKHGAVNGAGAGAGAESSTDASRNGSIAEADVEGSDGAAQGREGDENTALRSLSVPADMS